MTSTDPCLTSIPDSCHTIFKRSQQSRSSCILFYNKVRCNEKSAQQAVTRERSKELVDSTERTKEMAPCKTKRALNLAEEKRRRRSGGIT